MSNPLFTIMEADAQYLIEKVDSKNFKGKRILITGASGLIGLNFLAFLRAAREKCEGSLNVTSIIHSEPNEVIKHFASADGFNLISGDLTDPEFIKNIGKFDFIVHAASYGQPGRFMSDPIKTLKLNTVATFELFKLLEEGGTFLFVSTSEVYSGNPELPYREDQIGRTNTTHPRACYIEAKRCGEAICNSYRSVGIKAHSARLALAFGPGTKEDDQRVLNVFIKRALLTDKLTMQDMGKAIRTYCYITDAIEIMLNIMLTGKEPIYNVGGVEKITIASLAGDIAGYLGVPVQFPENIQTMSDAPEDVSLDMSLVKKEFGKTSFIPFNEGLKKTIEWQKSLHGKDGQ
jgi:UDP-glucuronate decarboxylase